MKKIIALLLMVWSTAYGQVYTPMAQNYEFKRHIKIDSTLNMAQAYADTTAANIAGSGLVAGRLIRIGNDFWMRNTALTAWLQFVNTGPGSTSIDAVWETDGNYSPTDPTTFKLGHIDSFPLRLYTNNVKRLEIPANGIQSVNGSQYRYLVYDTSGAILGYTSGLDTILVGRGIQKDSTGPGSSTIYLDSAYYTTVVHGDSTFGLRYNGDSTLFSVAGGGGGTGWSLTGNAGTDTSVNFFGTTDDKDIIIKRNNIRYGYYGVNSTGLGLYSLKYGNTGANNTSIGNYSMFNLTTGTQNTAVGFSALSELTTGDYNVGIGQGANRTTTGTGNVGVGYASLSSLTIGSHNVAVGAASGNLLTTGVNNTLIGDSATTATSSTDSSVAIGSKAVASTKQVAFSPHLTTMFLDLDSASGTAPAIAGIDKDGNWRKYATPSGGSPALTSTYVGVGNVSNVLSGSANFTEDGSQLSYNGLGGMSIPNGGLSVAGGTVSAIDYTGDWAGGIIYPSYGGTGVNNGSKTITIGGNLTTSGAFASTFTMTAATGVTFPTTGTLATLAGSETFTNKTITNPTLSGTLIGSGTIGGSTVINTAVSITGFNIVATGLMRSAAGSRIEHNGRNGFTATSDGFETLTSSAGTANTVNLSVASLRTGYVAKTANYTATAFDETISCSTNAFTITLPTAVGCAGQKYNITNSTAANTITVGTTSSQTFANVTATPTTISLIGLGAVIVVSDGANWLQLK